MAGRVPGRFEFELLTFLKANGPMSVREMHHGFGEPKGFVRGTIVKGVDRLLKKGLIDRYLEDGVYRYRIVDDSVVSESSLVSDFVNERLRGRITPLLAFFSEAEGLSPGEIEKLREIVHRLERGDG